jgi:Na+-translocating ferredoxin:NAD+ oxidoreductase RnfC subunit
MSLAERVKQAGVVGAGGGGFPTHVKLTAKADTVIANGAECEPLLHKDAVIMERRARKNVAGVELTMDAARPRTCRSANSVDLHQSQNRRLPLP